MEKMAENKLGQQVKPVQTNNTKLIQTQQVKKIAPQAKPMPSKIDVDSLFSKSVSSSNSNVSNSSQPRSPKRLISTDETNTKAPASQSLVESFSKRRRRLQKERQQKEKALVNTDVDLKTVIVQEKKINFDSNPKKNKSMKSNEKDPEIKTTAMLVDDAPSIKKPDSIMKPLSTVLCSFMTTDRFDALPINALTRKAISEVMKYETLTSVQKETLPSILNGNRRR
jgi:hypothetical protein